MEGLNLRALNVEEAGLERRDPDAEPLVGVAQAVGLRVAWFAEKRMKRGQCPITTRSLVVGGLPSAKAALRFLGQELPPPTDYPDSLAPFLGGEFGGPPSLRPRLRSSDRASRSSSSRSALTSASPGS